MVEHPSPKRRAASSSLVSPATVPQATKIRIPWPPKRTHRTSQSTSSICVGRCCCFTCSSGRSTGCGATSDRHQSNSRSRCSPVSSAVMASVILYRSDRIYGLANEVAQELKKVTWPTAKEVRSATIVVIVMAVVSAVILGIFDFAGRTSRSWSMADNAFVPEPNESDVSAAEQTSSSDGSSTPRRLRRPPRRSGTSSTLTRVTRTRRS